MPAILPKVSFPLLPLSPHKRVFEMFGGRKTAAKPQAVRQPPRPVTARIHIDRNPSLLWIHRRLFLTSLQSGIPLRHSLQLICYLRSNCKTTYAEVLPRGRGMLSPGEGHATHTCHRGFVTRKRRQSRKYGACFCPSPETCPIRPSTRRVIRRPSASTS